MAVIHTQIWYVDVCQACTHSFLCKIQFLNALLPSLKRSKSMLMCFSNPQNGCGAFAPTHIYDALVQTPPLSLASLSSLSLASPPCFDVTYARLYLGSHGARRLRHFSLNFVQCTKTALAHSATASVEIENGARRLRHFSLNFVQCTKTALGACATASVEIENGARAQGGCASAKLHADHQKHKTHISESHRRCIPRYMTSKQICAATLTS